MDNISRPTLGFLTANIHVGASRSLWRGVLDAAEAQGVGLICFPGGRLGSSESFEAERNLIFDLARGGHLSGLVSWTSALAGVATQEAVIEFHQRYRPLPIVSLATPLDGSPMISINGYQGMRALISHLTDVHGYERIALIRGPDGHPYASERYHAYLDALREKGLEARPDLISPAVHWEKGAQAMQAFIDERQLRPGRDLQAVVAVSDLLAIGAMSFLSQRGIRVPSDLAVLGFNDIEEGRLVRPSLTSVSLPFYQQGYRAVEVLLALLEGQDPPAHIMLDSRLLVRQSCGCPSQPAKLAAELVEEREQEDQRSTVRRLQSLLVEEIAQVISSRGVASTWAKQLIEAMLREIDGRAVGQFRATLDSMLQQGALDGDETAAWQTTISVFRRELIPGLDPEKRLKAEGLFGQARVVIGEAIQRAQVARQLQADQQNQTLRSLGQALITTFDTAVLSEVLARRITELGIPSCYLVLYESPLRPLDSARLILAVVDGQRLWLPPEGSCFPTTELLPADLLPAAPTSLLVEPLFFQTEAIGYVVFEVGPHNGDIYEVLRGHISTALKGALLFKQAHEARIAAERADQIKTRLLANVSHELRTPLNIILGYTQRLLSSNPGDVSRDLEYIQQSAEHQLRIINDLLDLSRAEIKALDLYPEFFDPRTLIEDAFASMADNADPAGALRWHLNLPDHLPVLEADPVRLRQILLNLLSNAARATEAGEISLGAAVEEDSLHLWVTDTGVGIAPELRDSIYEPFISYQFGAARAGGIGLGLSITRQLVALHKGRLHLESELGQGSTFHVYLPLPGPIGRSSESGGAHLPALWLISGSYEVPASISDFAAAQGYHIQRLDPSAEPGDLLREGLPAIVAWEAATSGPAEWDLIRRLHNHPRFALIPFVLYQESPEGEAGGLTSVIVKPASSEALWQALRPTLPAGPSGALLIIDDDPAARQLAREVLRRGLPAYRVLEAEDGLTGLALLESESPDLVILDLMMPGMDGFEVLEQMRSRESGRHIPVLILSGRHLNQHDIQRLEHHSGVTLQTKGILSSEETISAIQRRLGENELPPQSSALVKRALAYLHQHYSHPLTREEIAEGIGVNEDYLSRLFNRELGLSPWDYLTRYRIARAKELLRDSLDSIAEVGKRVGFADPAYFSRVFSRVTGYSPRSYRDHPPAE